MDSLVFARICFYTFLWILISTFLNPNLIRFDSEIIFKNYFYTFCRWFSKNFWWSKFDSLKNFITMLNILLWTCNWRKFLSNKKYFFLNVCSMIRSNRIVFKEDTFAVSRNMVVKEFLFGFIWAGSISWIAEWFRLWTSEEVFLKKSILQRHSSQLWSDKVATKQGELFKWL